MVRRRSLTPSRYRQRISLLRRTTQPAQLAPSYVSSKGASWGSY
jgi:hypothetical protein